MDIQVFADEFGMGKKHLEVLLDEDLPDEVVELSHWRSRVANRIIEVSEGDGHSPILIPDEGIKAAKDFLDVSNQKPDSETEVGETYIANTEETFGQVLVNLFGQEVGLELYPEFNDFISELVRLNVVDKEVVRNVADSIIDLIAPDNKNSVKPDYQTAYEDICQGVGLNPSEFRHHDKVLDDTTPDNWSREDIAVRLAKSIWQLAGPATPADVGKIQL